MKLDRLLKVNLVLTGTNIIIFVIIPFPNAFIYMGFAIIFGFWALGILFESAPKGEKDENQDSYSYN